MLSGEFVRCRTAARRWKVPGMQRAATERFRDGLARAVAHLGGDRAAEEASGVSKSVWYDAKSGRAVPDDRSTWPAMRLVLARIPAALTGVRDWDELYRLVCAERGRRPSRQRGSPPAEPGPARSTPQQLPPGTVPFVARDLESHALDEAILGGNGGSVPIAVVAGPPGVGKTALAVDWAFGALGRFPDGLLYVDMRGWGPDRPMTAEEVLPGWLGALGMDLAVLPDDVPGRAAALRSALAGRQVLMVLDNARSEEQVRPLLPGSPSCAVLVTSRLDLQGLAIHHGARVVTLDPLSSAAAARLLGQIAGAEVAGDAETLARLCGHLPLALRIVAESARGRSAAGIAALTGELDGEDRLDRLGSDDPRSDPRTVLSWSYGQLPADVRDTFRLLGLFPGRSFDTSAIAALTGAQSATTRPNSPKPGRRGTPGSGCFTTTCTRRSGPTHGWHLIGTSFRYLPAARRRCRSAATTRLCTGSPTSAALWSRFACPAGADNSRAGLRETSSIRCAGGSPSS